LTIDDSLLIGDSRLLIGLAACFGVQSSIDVQQSTTNQRSKIKDQRSSNQRVVRFQAAAALVIASVVASSCATRRPIARDYGIPSCPDGAERDLLSSDALQCWFMAVHGRWRTLNHQSHLAALVVEVEARDLRDAEEIARRVVGPVATAFSEVLVYTQAEPEDGMLRVRRVRWTRSTGFETLDFSSPQRDSPLTVRSGP
jgi:hypothetical protein